MNTIGDQQLVKRMNRSVLLRLLRAQPGLSRARLASESGLTKSTVSLLVRELLDDGWLSEATAAVGDGLGRPSTPLSINADVRVLIGVEMAVGCVRVAGVSLSGELLHAEEQPSPTTEPAPVCRQAAGMVAHACAVLQARGQQLSGIGLGLPGAVDDNTGVVQFAPNLGWRNVDVLPMFTAELAALGVPNVAVLLQNDADVAALGEYEFTDGEGEDPLIFVNCDVGVGAGIVLNDRLFTGAQGMAGEIGHNVLQVDGPLCSCGRHGCAEVFIALRALRGPASVQRAGRYLGVLLQNLWTTFNPRAIVVGGQSCVRAPELLGLAIESVQAYAELAGMPAPVMRAARHGPMSPAVGAAALVLHRTLRPLHTRMGPIAPVQAATAGATVQPLSL